MSNTGKGVERVFKFKSIEEKIEHETNMISFRFLSEVEKRCDKKGINRTQLAEMLGTSKSYITQLYRGDKVLSLEMIAKIQQALEIKFSIRSIHNPFTNPKKP